MAPLFDLPLPELIRRRPDVLRPADFEEFWRRTLEESAPRRRLEVVPVETGLRSVLTSDVAFGGFGGDRISAWWHRPVTREPLRGVVVRFIGYGGGRGLPHEIDTWPLAGFGQLTVDSRGQGWKAARPGVTPDPHGSEPSVPGHLTRGIESPESYYYRRFFVDAVRAVDAAVELGEGVPVIVAGGSQGGGVAIAAAALSSRVSAALVDVPFLCDIARAVTLTETGPYRELVEYFAARPGSVDATLRTLSYFDGVNMARQADVPALFSVALMDRVCPPSTVYAAYNWWSHPDKQIESYPFNQHEGGGPVHRRLQLEWLERRFPG